MRSIHDPAQEASDPRAAAAILASSPLFASLTPIDRAKLAAVLEDRAVPAGEVVFEAGGRGDALYILRSGTAERWVAGSAIGTLVPPDIFGELALLTDEPRSASVVARTPLLVWVLPRARFQPLLQAEPELLLRLSAAVSRQLAAARATLGELQSELDGWVSERLAELTPRQRNLVQLAAVLERLDPELLALATESSPNAAEPELAEIASRSPLIAGDVRGYRVPTAIRGAVVRCLDTAELRRRLGPGARETALALQARGEIVAAMALYLASGSTDDARRLYGAAPEPVRRALLRDDRLPSEWRAQLGLGATAEPWREAASGTDSPPDHPPRAGDVRARLRLLGALAAALPLVILWSSPPPGLAVEGWRALLVLIAGALLLAFDVFPDAIVALLMAAGWVVPGVVEARVALAGFSSEAWLLVLSVLAVGVAVGNTGLLYRAALIALTRAPTAYAWRVLVLALVGILVTPTIPNATSRVALAAPIVREVAEALSYQAGSRAAAGLGLAALVGFGQMAGLFLTGSSVGLLVHGLLPPETRAQFGFGAWFLAALPVHLVLFALAIGAIVVWYRPEVTTEEGARRLALQRAVLGRTSRAEWLSLTVLVGLVAGFLTEPFHQIDPSWWGVAALVLLVQGGVLDATTLRTGVNWSFLIFFGAITSLGSVFSALQIDRWLAELLATPVGALAATPTLFCIGLALAGFALSLVVRWQAAAPLLTLVATPAASAAGIHPFLVALIALVATQAWFLPFQSTLYLAIYHGSGELFSHTQARRLALVWGPMVLLALVTAVPVWRWMGLLR